MKKQFNKNNKELFIFSAAVLFFFIASNYCSAYTTYYQDYDTTNGYQAYPSYQYQGNQTYQGYQNPGYQYQGNQYYQQPSFVTYHYNSGDYDSVYTPYPQYYIVTKSSSASGDCIENYNLNAYKDLDILHPDGTIDVYKNDNAPELDLSQINTSMKTFGEHVYGFLPDGSVYVKHYLHEHPLEDDYAQDGYYTENDYVYNYGYNNYGYGNYGYNTYFTPSQNYLNKPVYTHPCQVQSICQKTNSCC